MAVTQNWLQKKKMKTFFRNFETNFRSKQFSFSRNNFENLLPNRNIFGGFFRNSDWGPKGQASPFVAAQLDVWDLTPGRGSPWWQFNLALVNCKFVFLFDKTSSSEMTSFPGQETGRESPNLPFNLTSAAHFLNFLRKIIK